MNQRGCPQNLNQNEVLVCNTLFMYDLVETTTGSNVYDLICTPCNTPTAVYNVARITLRENSCNQIQYYQAFINTDPVEIIQDCNLENCVTRCIEIYFCNLEPINCSNCNGNSTGCCGLGLF